jgi:hypothetical protein
LAKEDKGITLTTELVGIKNLKTTFEIDTHKVKDLIDKLNKAFVMALVDYD